ncbi:hypothetical protein [Porphyromonas cangingivalis]|uniref:Uncharacterized protein n=1 Tax=Porphyromonas cangingivalis TaxID=36874 RepID=A0A1T4M3W8_PORCN|nr:hypothetical protein [Porphyromonas cangingivalis]SJZ61587.1 hypothetical protein SAMN02745205_01384 [Porphyromonas cangingivalis]VEJ03785.1 Uncharacterised protein [Porphyromonas cangingivalis]
MKRLLVASTMALALFSCKKDLTTDVTPSLPVSVTIDQISFNNQFAKALSKAVAQNLELAPFLQQEALKEFDNNTDILYHKIKDIKLASGATVRELILSQWEGTTAEFATFEQNTPLLNIFASDLGVFSEELDLKNWNLSGEVGVATDNSQGSKTLYVSGDSVAALSGSDLPMIPTFVINKNRRVKVKSTLRSSGSENLAFTYEFAHPAYDGTNNNKLRASKGTVWEEPLGNGLIEPSELPMELKQAFSRSLSTSKLAQRALLYYGLNNNELNTNFNETLYRFKIDKAAYGTIAGDNEDYDPKVLEDESVWRYGQVHADIDEIIAQIWTEGHFAFSFEVLTPYHSGGILNQQLIFNVSPKELFKMNPLRDDRPGNFWRRTRYIYTLDKNEFESRWVYPHKLHNKTYVRFGNAWDLKEQGLHKLIRVTELDKGNTIEHSDSFSAEFLENSKSSFEASISALIKGVTVGVKGGGETNRGSKFSKVVSGKSVYNDENDILGTLVLYFTDPVVLKSSNEGYELFNVSNGTVTASFVPIKVY